MWPNPQLKIWSRLLKKSLMQNFIFCTVFLLVFVLQVSKFISKSHKNLYHFSNQRINLMPLGRHSILIYSLGDEKPAENPAVIHGEALILQKKRNCCTAVKFWAQKNNNEVFEGRSKSFRVISVRWNNNRKY